MDVNKIGLYLKQTGHWLLSRCRGCGRSLDQMECPLCVACSTLVAGTSNHGGAWTVSTEPFPLRALFLWNDTDSRASSVLRSLIFSSKVDPSEDHVRWISDQFLLRISSSKEPVFLSPPGRSGRWESDHAGAIAGKLAQRLNCEVFKGLRGNRMGQKERGRSERLQREFLLASDQIEVSRDRLVRSREIQWIFVDDVIATGSTARAAWEALERPGNFEAWAIAWKQRER